MVFLKEEVLVTELKQAEEKVNIFASRALPQDNSDYVLYKVVKVGEKQQAVKVGDEVLISGQVPKEIKIKNFGVIPDIKKIINADPIFALYAKSKV